GGWCSWGRAQSRCRWPGCPGTASRNGPCAGAIASADAGSLSPYPPTTDTHTAAPPCILDHRQPRRHALPSRGAGGSAAMTYDLLIRNGTVVDGTGAPRHQADVAVAEGRIAEIGKIRDGAVRTIDAAGCIVAPGFIDPHTHYDAQICWDPAVSPSLWHGVTSVVMGNCGVGIAPCRPEAREIATRDLVNVEAIPFEVLKQGITWDWVTFPEFLAAADQRGSALNLGFIAPLTPFRHYVMGEASLDRAATQEETSQITAMLREAVDTGAFGWSTTVLNQHVGYEARPLARAELKAYCNALKEAGKGAIEIALTQKVGVLTDEEEDLL